MAKTLFELTEGNAPALTDYALTGEDPLGTHVLRRTTWQSIKNLIYADVTKVADNGWVSIPSTFGYVSATSFTITGDYRNIIQVGDKIMTSQTTTKFFVVLSVSYTSPQSTITVTGGTDYSLANATFPYVYYSHMSNPMWFPQWFNWTPNITNMTVVGTPTYSGMFSVNGRTVVGQMELQATTSLASAGSTTYCPVPVTGAFAKSFTVSWTNDYAADMPTGLLVANGNIFFPAWTASGRKMVATFTYEI